MMLSKERAFVAMCKRAQQCSLCPQMGGRTAVLSELNGSLKPKVMFIGEAPGRVGSDRTRRPFYGDKSGDNLQKLLDSIGLTRDEIFITSAVLCNPRSATEANRKPTRKEIVNCSHFLQQTIDLVEPPVVATLGAVGLEGLKLIEPHRFTLRENAGTVLEWNGRPLVPLYHPSPQVIASQRGLDIQLAHFQVLGQLLRGN